MPTKGRPLPTPIPDMVMPILTMAGGGTAANLNQAKPRPTVPNPYTKKSASSPTSWISCAPNFALPSAQSSSPSSSPSSSSPSSSSAVTNSRPAFALHFFYPLLRTAQPQTTAATNNSPNTKLAHPSPPILGHPPTAALLPLPTAPRRPLVPNMETQPR
jgi:hypothetical protein